MMPTSSLKRGNTFSRSALGLALSLGVASGAFIAQPALAAKKNEQPAGPKIEFSKPFAAAAAELDKALIDGSKNPAVQAASTQARAAKDPAAKSAAAAQVDAALGGAKAKLDASAAVATTPGDKLKLGEMTRSYGVLVDDLALQHNGLAMMLDSGVLAPAMVPQVQWLTGVTAYQQRDYAGAVKYIQPAFAAGYRDSQGLLPQVLADAYKRTNNAAGALSVAQAEISAAKTAGTKPSETAIRTALQAAYDAKQMGPATDLAVALVQNYPNPKTWNASINVVRALASYQSQEALDLMRLMGRTNSYETDRDYVEYIQAVDPRRLPGEAQKVLDAGVAAGKLKTSDPFVAEARGIVTGRLAADRASLPGLERDARAANASAATVSGAGDAFLSYGDAAKAEALYTIALAKSGADSERVLTRLGIAQADQGKAAEAQANFAKVQGPRKPIAQLWSAYAAQKAGGATPVAAAQ
jgi:tetratricopeptide (TPR) repeat protein